MGTVLKPKCAKCGAPTLRQPHPCGLHFCSEACKRATESPAKPCYSGMNSGDLIAAMLRDGAGS